MSEVPGMPPLFYRAEGEGPLVIMLHGLLMNGRCWDDNGFIAATFGRDKSSRQVDHRSGT